MKYCTHCGKELNDDVIFCTSCGTKTAEIPKTAAPEEPSDGFFKTVTAGINTLSGGDGSSIASLKDLVSDVFRKHTPEESEKIFICGTESTTPKLTELGSDCPKPWLYSRVLVIFAATFLLLDLCIRFFQNANSIPGVIFMGSFMVPLTLLVLFFELNIPKNMSILNVIKLFLLGGGASLLMSGILYDIIPLDKMDGYTEAVFIGIIEEIAKLIIVFLFLKKENKFNFLVNALLIGAAVGAGFAAFESAGYAFRYDIAFGYDKMMEVILLRAILAPGGHIVWAAITGFAMTVAKGNGTLTLSVFASSAFWKLFWIPVVLHAVWDMPIEFGSKFYFIPILLTVISWVVILVLIDRSFKQVGTLCAEAKQKENLFI